MTCSIALKYGNIFLEEDTGPVERSSEQLPKLSKRERGSVGRDFCGCGCGREPEKDPNDRKGFLAKLFSIFRNED